MIKIATEAEINQINELGKILYPNFKVLYNVKKYIEDSNYIVLVDIDNEVNGFIIVYKNMDCYELEMLIVSETMRNNGIATKLLNYFINNFCKDGEVIMLEVSSINNVAINLYKKFDFKIINIRKNYYKDADAYIMKKVI